jgi:hypothetical protein
MIHVCVSSRRPAGIHAKLQSNLAADSLSTWHRPVNWTRRPGVLFNLPERRLQRIQVAASFARTPPPSATPRRLIVRATQDDDVIDAD